jgi:glycosyltransferase involved in cell wall biosynthesis
MNLAITMATYQRKDGKSPFYLKRAIDSVFAQKHGDFKLFVVGDRYEDDAEFRSILSSYPGERLRCVNLTTAVEREKYQNNKEYLWNNGGVHAFNLAAAHALEEGFDYICHLDHDDYWTPNHLTLINEVIECTQADWMCTRTQHPTGVLPVHVSRDYLIPFLPLPGGIIKSSTCYNYRTIPLCFRDAGDVPADYDLWKRMAVYIRDHDLVSYFINELTCIYEEGGYERN